MGRFINVDALIATGKGMLGNNMVIYCNNNPSTWCDPNGYMMHSTLNVGPDGIQPIGCGWGGVSYYDKPTISLGEVLSEHICISGGLGFGLYTEANMRYLGFGLGTYYDKFAFEYQDGKLTTYEYGYAGISSSIVMFDVGADVSVLVDEDHGTQFNPEKDAIDLLGIGFYTPIFGGRIKISFR